MKNVIIFFGLLSFFFMGFSQEKGTFKDTRDGNVYKTVKIGNQIWLAENLAFKPESGKYWIYKNDSNNVTKYGFLYDWETAKKVVPVGWHIPSKEEWDTLYQFLGGNKIIVYNALKQGGISGFSALSSGYCYGNTIREIGRLAFFWSTTTIGNGQAYFFYFNAVNNLVEISSGDHSCGVSVRLLKD